MEHGQELIVMAGSLEDYTGEYVETYTGEVLVEVSGEVKPEHELTWREKFDRGLKEYWTPERKAAARATALEYWTDERRAEESARQKEYWTEERKEEARQRALRQIGR